jgi:hypothetical protein
LLNELVEDINKYYHEIQSNSEDFKKEKEDKSLDQYKTPYIMTLFEIIKRVIRIVLAYL